MNDTPQQVVAQNVTKALKKNDAVRAVWYFGATAWGRTWEGSDVDMLVVTTSLEPPYESHAPRNDTEVHFHWWGESGFWKALELSGDLRLQRVVATGTLLFDRSGDFQQAVTTLEPFPNRYRVYHLVPHLEALLAWARDLDKRMALGDERPRRAQHRMWEVDNHAAAVLLIEKGVFPHNDPTTQALNERLFVPNLASPAEIEAFVAPRTETWLLPQLIAWDVHNFDSAELQGEYGLAATPYLLDFAQRQGWLKKVRVSDRSGFPIQETVYRLA